MICAKFEWIWSSGSEEEDFLKLSTYFHYLVIISPWKWEGPFIWTNLNSLNTKMIFVRFGWNWPSGSGEEDENVKSLRQCQRSRTTNKFWLKKLTGAFGSGELKRREKNKNCGIKRKKSRHKIFICEFLQNWTFQWFFTAELTFNFHIGVYSSGPGDFLCI